MKRLPKNVVFAVSVRWGAWVLAVALLTWSGAWSRLAINGLPLIALMYATLYLSLWTRAQRMWLRHANDLSVAILYDLLLSAIPVLIDNGWGSPFMLLPLSVLVVPAALRGWRATLPVAASFLAIDQAILWATTPNPWQITAQGSWAAFALLGRTALPFGVIVGAALGGRLLRWFMARRRPRPVPPRVRWEQSSVQSLLASSEPRDEPTFGRARADEPRAGWSKERGTPSTLERRQPPNMQVALNRLALDLQTAGVVVSVAIDGDARGLPPQVYELLTHATAVALDNVLVHAHARTVAIDLHIGAEIATLFVQDDGIGLFDGTAEPPGFHQLKRLRFRAAELDGALHVEERDEGGVLLRLSVPLVIAE